MKRYDLILLGLLSLLVLSCRREDYADRSDEQETKERIPYVNLRGMYHLNEGNMGMNRASLDYMDFATGAFHRDIFARFNPKVVKELGDVGNDLQIYGDKAYALINVSGLVVVFDIHTARRLAEIKIPNVRYITFEAGMAYLSSYASRVGDGPRASEGFVAELDTETLSLTGRQVRVGYQPEQMVAYRGRLYVANSGGYRAPNYERTISVVDLASMTEVDRIEVDLNLHLMALDDRGQIFVTSRGDYGSVPARLHVVDAYTGRLKTSLDIPISGMDLLGDRLYYYSVRRDASLGKKEVSFGVLDTRSLSPLPQRLITDGTEGEIITPYGIAVHPESKYVMIADVQNYVSSGYISCYSTEGKRLWRIPAGNIPGHFAFTSASPFDRGQVPKESRPTRSHITKVYDYRPAPGQFVNQLPLYEQGDTQADMNRKVLEAIGSKQSGLVTLGGWGGYVEVGFDMPIINKEGSRDFRIVGNFYYGAHPSDPKVRMSNSEPGIVQVGCDHNGNGKPDPDEWYELAGSEFHKETTTRGYRLSYQHPSAVRSPRKDPNHSYIYDRDYIKWSDDRGKIGYIPQNIYHTQSYYPSWIGEERLSFEGTLLAPNGRVEQGADGSELWLQPPYGWGYADNSEPKDEGSTFDIGWAVNREGKSVRLERIDFVRVYTGVHQICGWLGESSTELAGIVDLHR